MVPRALWAGKPIFMTGLQFSREYYELPPSAYTASADTMIGGYYWHGGWIPVLAGMLIFGSAVRLLDNVLDTRTNPHAILLVFPAFS